MFCHFHIIDKYILEKKKRQGVPYVTYVSCVLCVTINENKKLLVFNSYFIILIFRSVYEIEWSICNPMQVMIMHQMFLRKNLIKELFDLFIL